MVKKYWILGSALQDEIDRKEYIKKYGNRFDKYWKEVFKAEDVRKEIEKFEKSGIVFKTVKNLDEFNKKWEELKKRLIE